MLSIYYVLNLFILLIFYPIISAQLKDIRENVPVLESPTDFQGEEHVGSENKKHIVFIGESTMVALGMPSHKEAFAGTFARNIAESTYTNISWKVYAKNGITAQRVHSKLLKQINDEQVDLFVIGLGGNDSFRFTPPWRWRKDMENIINYLQSNFPSSKIVIINMPPTREFPVFSKLMRFIVGNMTDILRMKLKGIEGENVLYLDNKITLNQFLSIANDTKLTIDDFFETDRLHPSLYTYQLWATSSVNDIFKKGFIKKEGL